jgi:MFS transporter, DHA1 family, multidrug resistance protein
VSEARVRRRLTRSSELIALLALSVALAALGIDIMLPALGAIRADLGLAPDATAGAWLVTAYILGLAVGQLFYGPVADRFGRRPTLYVGYAIYAAAALAAAASTSLTLLLVSRFVWGLGAAGPRVVTMAVIRDSYEGERMARAMSLLMAVFVVVPIVAPSLGAGIVLIGSWRWVFGVCFLAVVMMSVWARRLPETLREEHRRELRFQPVMRAARHVVTNRQTVTYTLALSILFGVFLSYIASSEIIVAETFDRAGWFPFIFGGLATVMGLSMLVNARVVERVGTRRLAHGALLVYNVLAVVLVVVVTVAAGRPPLWLFLIGLAGMLASQSLLIPNLNTVAMTPMAAVAGTAASVIGAVQMGLGAVLGAVIDRAFDGTVLPLSLGFLGYGLVALGLILYGERGRLFQPLVPPPEVPPALPTEA